MQIAQDGSGALSGKVIKGLGANDQPDRRCTACTDARKDQLILGMTIISDMKKDGDGWDHGQILDPENGKLYKCKMHLEDGGQQAGRAWLYRRVAAGPLADLGSSAIR